MHLSSSISSQGDPYTQARTDDASFSNVRARSWRKLMQTSEQVNNIAQITAQK